MSSNNQENEEIFIRPDFSSISSKFPAVLTLILSSYAKATAPCSSVSTTVSNKSQI